jgi:hypothetical protein
MLVKDPKTKELSETFYCNLNGKEIFSLLNINKLIRSALYGFPLNTLPNLHLISMIVRTSYYILSVGFPNNPA